MIIERPGDLRCVEAVRIAASRYGAPKPPDRDFHLYLLNEKQQVLADVAYPYATIERGDVRWYTLRTPSVEVPERFYVALAFDPDRNKGIYLGMDNDVEKSHSLIGLPADGFDPVDKKCDWMVCVWMSKEPSGEKGVQRLADWQPPKEVNAFEGCTEAKYDTGKSDDIQSYARRGPRIVFSLGDFVSGAVPDDLVIKGFRVYGNRYGAGFDPETTMIKLAVLDKAGEVLCEQQFPYSLFSPRAQWVDLPLSTPLKIDKALVDAGAFAVAIDPEARQDRGIYFHYDRNPAQSHSGFGSVKDGFEDLPGREWLIRTYITR
ncbi:MAG TPA: hypothetical protein PLO37_17535 [Candidatus Hydrogenedentes bacterium]|nr:hypothetical protein [Candidatus Hydrogenedentota bacterium]HPG68651.1 hypothetical protein [Candidatus Hydrogenedentota bacterium]